MPLDAKVRAFLDQMAGMPELHTLPVAEARQGLEAMAAMQGDAEPIAAFEDRRVPGPAGDIPVRVYTPAGARPLPVLVYFHGGGWVVGSLTTHDGVCRALANRVPAIVVSVDYRLAPEHPFPAAAEDAYAATAWTAANAATIGGDADRIGVGGDSAGGNLAAVTALMARDRGGPRLVHQLLVYPVTDARFDTPSYVANADGYFLTRDMMRWFWNHYAARAADRENAYAAPFRAKDLAGLPPATVLTAEFDPLRDEGEAYARRLREAGVPVDLTRYDGIVHGFFGMAALFDQAEAAIDEAAGALRTAFSR